MAKGSKAFGGRKAAPFPKGGGPRPSIMPKPNTRTAARGKGSKKGK